MHPIQAYGTTPRFSRTRLSEEKPVKNDSLAPAAAPVARRAPAPRFTDWAMI